MPEETSPEATPEKQVPENGAQEEPQSQESQAQGNTGGDSGETPAGTGENQNAETQDTGSQELEVSATGVGDGLQDSDDSLAIKSPASELASFPNEYEVETNEAGDVVAVESVMVQIGGYIVNLPQAKAAIYTAKRDVLEIIKDQVTRAARRSGTSLEGIAGDVIPPVPANLNFKFNGLIHALQSVGKREPEEVQEILREIQSVILARHEAGK